MFARFDENPAMTLRVIKETKRYGRTDGRTDARTDGRTDGQRENSIPPTNKVCGGYKNSLQEKLGRTDSQIGRSYSAKLSRLAIDQSICILTRPVVITGFNRSLLVDWWSIGRLKKTWSM